jgi:hypothetical protein
MQATDDPVVKNIISQREAALTACAVLGAQVTQLQAQVAELQKRLVQQTAAADDSAP